MTKATGLLAALLVACGGGDGDDDGPTPDAAPTEPRQLCSAFSDDVTYKMTVPAEVCSFDIDGLNALTLSSGAPFVQGEGCGANCTIGNPPHADGPGRWQAVAMRWDGDPGELGVAIPVADLPTGTCVWRRCSP